MGHVLVTGGAGYIGSHACKALKAAGHTPVTFDNLVTGWQDAVKFGPFEKGDLLDRVRLDEVFAAYEPIAVMHFAALSQVGESMAEPGLYWRNNVVGSLNLIEAAVAAGCGLCFLRPARPMAIRTMWCWTKAQFRCRLTPMVPPNGP